MTIAELHGKLAPDKPNGVHDRMEDLLTSDVFGTMKYTGWQHGFLDWLLLAEPAPIEPAPPPISTYLVPERTTQVGYRFWPTLRNKREADVGLLFCFEERDPLLILIEAKYKSGTSDWDGGEPGDPYSLTGNQIADQVRGLNQMMAHELLNLFEPALWFRKLNDPGSIQKVHLFVTIHTVLPARDYELSKKKLSAPWPLPAYWLSWTSLAECLSNHLDASERCVRELIGDLCRLLHRKELVPFIGFSMEPWRGSAKRPSFWREQWWSYALLAVGEYESFWRTSK